ncbi:hypothetical protein [Candidatus Enterococcus courvalinii]|uniref:Uncharacterized protein n=1 Tax=Candidatus Enterococcus courvalinii TaxID=2815329 RepID=A0ABS3HZN7_9ENTE|nr:hypothetical protein [Enterococcus sp. MSG2901]MBO0481928.1 hypothetical protein [Enterococcus sp. MSG2901]
MSKAKKNLLIIGIGTAIYLLTAYVYRHVILFAEPLDQLYQSDSGIIKNFSAILIWLLFSPALRVMTIIVCIVLLITVNKKKK